ncbi:MAG: lipopolysaccharide kinase InaA family protein [Candidatus Brocadiia bacterium]
MAGPPEKRRREADDAAAPARGWRVVRGALTDEGADVLSDLDAAFSRPSSVILREGNTRKTAILQDLGSVWKWQFRIKSREIIPSLLGESPVREEFDLTRRAANQGIRAPEPLFAAERRRLGFLREAVIAFELIPDSLSLDRGVDILERDGGQPLSREESMRAIRLCGAMAARMHAAGILHNDLTADNIQVQRREGDLRVWFLDWCMATFPGKVSEVARLHSIGKLAHNLTTFGVSDDELGVLCSSYCESRPEAGPSAAVFRERVMEEVQRLTDHLVVRVVRNALRKSRRLTIRRRGGFTLACLKGVSIDRLAATLAGVDEVPINGPPEVRPLEVAEVVQDNRADQTWTVGCLAERYRLPVRTVLGALVQRASGRGWVVLAGAAPRWASVDDSADGEETLKALRPLAELLHRHGLRFRSLAEGDIRRVASGSPVAARTEGLLVWNPTVLVPAPESDTAESWHAVRNYAGVQ